MTDDEWDSVIATHLRGTFLAAQASQAHMTQHGSGKMVLISSISALGNRGQLNYSAAKPGIQAMTRQTAERIGVDFEGFQKMAAEQTPLQRIGEPEDIAGVIVFLGSEDAGYVSGQVIYVRGGP
jgi:3-oxoacyl-[acyl-carrier protein] reductase